LTFHCHLALVSLNPHCAPHAGPSGYRSFISAFEFLNIDLARTSNAQCVATVDFYVTFLVSTRCQPFRIRPVAASDCSIDPLGERIATSGRHLVWFSSLCVSNKTE